MNNKSNNHNTGQGLMYNKGKYDKKDCITK